MKKTIARLLNRIGRRGSYLIFLALLDFLYGYSILVQAGPLFTQVNLFLSDKTWGVVWIAVAAVLVAQAFAAQDRVGYVVACLIKFIWGSIMLFAFLTQANDPRGWVAAVIWYAFGVLTAIVSNWPEHKILSVKDFNGDR